MADSLRKKILFQFGEQRKVLDIQGGETLTDLTSVLRRDFDIAGNVVLQRYDESWSEWLDIAEQEELQDRAKIRVVLLRKKDVEDVAEKTGTPVVQTIDTGNNYDSKGINSEKLCENLDIATDVYIDRVNGSACCGTILQLYKGGQNEAISERRQSLLVFLKGKKKEKTELKERDPDLFKYFENIWTVRKNHMNMYLPENYMFVLNLCFKPECPHPLCADKSVGRDATWYEQGPALSYIPVPVPDPKRPWGGKCQECSAFCSGHYMSPKEHEEFVKEHGATGLMYKPPSVVIRDKFYESMKTGKSLSDSELEDVARKTLLSIEELTMHVEHLRITAERRKEGAKKAALTRKSKSTTTATNERKGKEKAKKKKKAKKDGASLDNDEWCWCRREEYGDMLMCEGKNCPIKWFHFQCMGLLYSPAFSWYCPDCNDEPKQYCLCNQPEFGLMLACDNKECTLQWFHLSCMGLPSAPKGAWLCPRCES